MERKTAHENKLLERVSKLPWFYKFLFGFIPPFIYGMSTPFLSTDGIYAMLLPRWMRMCLLICFAWATLNSWAWLIIGAQVHWKSNTRGIVSKIFAFVSLAMCIAFSLI